MSTDPFFKTKFFNRWIEASMAPPPRDSAELSHVTHLTAEEARLLDERGGGRLEEHGRTTRGNSSGTNLVTASYHPSVSRPPQHTSLKSAMLCVMLCLNRVPSWALGWMERLPGEVVALHTY